jgi:hypothetical protein
MKNALLYFILLGILLGGCAETHSDRGVNSRYTSPISIENIKINMEFLASDELEGRDTATRGEELAALYLKSEMKKYGIGFFDEIGDYYQEIALIKTSFDENSTITVLDAEDKKIADLEYLTDFVGSSRTYPPMDTVANLVFAGYGITADEYNYNDYDSVDVTGKFVMVWPGEPVSEDIAYFSGEEDTKYSSLFKKISTAKKQGALGIFLVSKREEKYGWESIINYAGKGTLKLRDPEEESGTGNNRLPRIILKSTALEEILNFSKYSYHYIVEVTSSGQTIPTFEMQAKIKVKLNFVSDSTITANNVIGYFAGTDPVLKNEIVAIGCHYDHIGKSGAGIYNGADDNASGTVATLEVARAVAYNKEFKRSVLFAFHTGEEKGLLGSKFLTTNLKAIDDIVSYINLDMVGRGPTDSIYNIGADKLSTEFNEIVELANSERAQVVFDYKYNAPDDPNRYYYRSDHYNYARQMIPVVFFFDDMTEDYHKVTDTAEKINYEKLAKISDLCYNILKITANRDTRPEVDKPITLKQ